jgi:hypothetical protein
MTDIDDDPLVFLGTFRARCPRCEYVRAVKLPYKCGLKVGSVLFPCEGNEVCARCKYTSLIVIEVPETQPTLAPHGFWKIPTA